MGVVIGFIETVRQYGGGFKLGPVNGDIMGGLTYVMGANGAGKSTLFRLISGEDAPTSGSIEYVQASGRPSVGYLPQDARLPGQARVIDYLYYAAWYQGVARGVRDSSVAKALESTDLVEHKRVRIRKLSGGTQRRVAIAASIVHGPRIVLLDEPTSGLDPAQRVQLRRTVQAFAANRCVLVSTHLVEDLTKSSGQVLVLVNGDFTYHGSVADLDKASASSGVDLEEIIAEKMGQPR